MEKAELVALKEKYSEHLWSISGVCGFGINNTGLVIYLEEKSEQAEKELALLFAPELVPYSVTVIGIIEAQARTVAQIRKAAM